MVLCPSSGTAGLPSGRRPGSRDGLQIRVLETHHMVSLDLEVREEKTGKSQTVRFLAVLLSNRPNCLWHLQMQRKQD